MRIVCPSCHAAYDVPDQVVARRRKLRCARCAADFTTQAPEPAVQPPAAPAQTPVAARVPAAAPPAPAPAAKMDPVTGLRPEKPPATRAPRAAIAAGWVASVALLGAMGWSAITWRGPIMQAWPASTRAYAALGYIK